MSILLPLFIATMIVLASLHSIQQFRDQPVAMTVCCLMAFLLMYVLF